MEGTGHPEPDQRQQPQPPPQPDQPERQLAPASWRGAGARGARAGGGGPSSLGSEPPPPGSAPAAAQVAEQQRPGLSHGVKTITTANSPVPAPSAPSAPQRAPDATDTAAALAAAASALAVEATKRAACEAGGGSDAAAAAAAAGGRRRIAGGPLSQTPTPPPVPELDGMVAAADHDHEKEEENDVVAGHMDMTALAAVSAREMSVENRGNDDDDGNKDDEEEQQQQQQQEKEEEAKSTKGRRFWAALRKSPIDPVSNRPICFGYNRGLLEDPQQAGCFRGASCPFAHVSLATVPGAERALAILVAEARGTAMPAGTEAGATRSSLATAPNHYDGRPTAAAGGFGPRRGQRAHNIPPPQQMQASSSDPGPFRDWGGAAVVTVEGLEGMAGVRSQNPSPAGSTVSGVVVPRAATGARLAGGRGGQPQKQQQPGVRMPRNGHGQRVCYFFNRGGCTNAACDFSHVMIDPTIMANIAAPGRPRASSYSGHAPPPAPAPYYPVGASYPHHYVSYGPPPPPPPHAHMIPVHGQPQEVVLYTHPGAPAGATATIATIVPVYHHMAPAPAPPEAGYHHHPGAGGWGAVQPYPPAGPYYYGYGPGQGVSPGPSRTPSPPRLSRGRGRSGGRRG